MAQELKFTDNNSINVSAALYYCSVGWCISGLGLIATVLQTTVLIVGWLLVLIFFSF